MSKRAQRPSYAVPGILAATLGFLFLYLLMVYPEERAALLGQNLTKNESPLGPGTEIIFSDGYTGEIGIASGSIEFTKNLGSAILSYPAIPQIADGFNNSRLRTTIFSSDRLNLNANNINLENTQQVYIFMNITKIKGSPKIVIFYNLTKIYEKDAVIGETIIPVPADLVSVNNPIFIQLKHNGALWESQEINGDIQAVWVSYSTNKENTLKENTIIIGADQFKGSILRLTLNASGIAGSGNLLIKLNDQIIYSGKPDLNLFTVTTTRISDTLLQVGENRLVLEADKGSSFTISSAKFELVSESAPVATKTYSFDVPILNLTANRTIKLAIKIDKIISPGYLYATIQPNMGTYYFAPHVLASGAWSYETLDKAKLKDFGNKIFVNSPDGRFVVSGFMIVLV